MTTHYCTGKAAFDSWQLAMKVRGRNIRQHSRSQVYQCDACGKWHIGTRAPKGARIGKRRVVGDILGVV